MLPRNGVKRVTRFAANLTMMFTEVEFLDRFKAAADAGFKAVEFQFPYEYDKEVLLSKLEENNLKLVLINAPAGDWEAGERGLATLPSRTVDFEHSIQQAISYAQTLGCPRVHVMAGVSADTPEARTRYVANMSYAAKSAAEANLEILIEAINPRVMPGYFLNNIELANDLLNEIDLPNMSLMFDFFHAQIIHGDVTTMMRKLIKKIGHVQIASVPQRNEPDQGELDYGYVLQELDRAGYQSWIGAEYHPIGQTQANLGWMTTLLPTGKN